MPRASSGRRGGMKRVKTVRSAWASAIRSTHGRTRSIQGVCQSVPSWNRRCMSTQRCTALSPRGPCRNPPLGLILRSLPEAGRSRGLLQRLLVDRTRRELVQLLVGGLLLGQGLAEQVRNLVIAESLGEGMQRAVAGDLVMLDLLRSYDEGAIEHLRILDLFHLLLGFLDQAFHGFTLLATAALVEELEDLFEPVNLPLGLLEVHFDRLLQLIR